MSIPIEWSIGEDVKTVFSNHMLIQADRDEVYLSFFDMPPPIVFQNEGVEAIKEIPKVTARCVARIAISASRFPSFAKVIQRRLEIDTNATDPREEQ